MEYKKEIEEINAHISDALKDWSDILLKAEYDNWPPHDVRNQYLHL